MDVMIYILAALTLISWIYTAILLRKHKGQRSQKPMNFTIVSTVITTLWVMFMFIKSLN